MNNPCDRAGQFRGIIREYGILAKDGGSVGVNIQAELTEWWDGEKWHPWSDYNQIAYGYVCLVDTKQTVNQKGVDSLLRYAGWDGNIESIANNTWQPTPCQFAIGPDEYKGKSSFKINFVNDFERTSGSMSTASPEKVVELQRLYGAQFRALAGGVKRNAAAPNGAPKSPPSPPPAPKPAAQSAPKLPVNEDADTVPF